METATGAAGQPLVRLFGWFCGRGIHAGRSIGRNGGSQNYNDEPDQLPGASETQTALNARRLSDLCTLSKLACCRQGRNIDSPLNTFLLLQRLEKLVLHEIPGFSRPKEGEPIFRRATLI